MNNRSKKTANATAITEIARRIEDIQNLWTANDRVARAEEGDARREQLLAMLGVTRPTESVAA